ncbi:MAG: hypothetical protein AMJ53_00615 [Gammaproteobacteria bacterium SG8_11]|nr:MAG: hypothetical protein AMJ53_00615 [Gammaproteobacteria bacterium SG8_11]
MTNYGIRLVLIFFLIESLLFSSFIHAEQLSLPAADVSAPEVEHEPVNEPLSVGAMHQIKATVTDNVGVETVSLFYRRAGDSQYIRKAMLREAKDSDIYSITLGTKDLAAPGIEYYIQATDVAGNSVLYGYSFEPIKLSVLTNADLPADASDSSFTEALNGDTMEKKKRSYKWVWIALGALAVGAVAAAASGGGGGDDGGQSGSENPGSVTISAPVP